MITNDRQYKIAKSQLQKFQQSIDDFDLHGINDENVHPLLIEGYRAALVSQVKSLLNSIEEYEHLKAGATVIAEVNSLKELPLVLIKSRIANGLTQAQLAEALGMKEQQLQRYEAEQYETASLKTLLRIADYLKIEVKADVQIKQIEATDAFNVKNYPLKQMLQRGWFDFTGSLNDAVKKSELLISGLFEKAGLRNIEYSLTKKNVRTGSAVNLYALNAWYARIIIRARQITTEILYSNDVINDEWLRQLAMLSVEENGPVQAQEYLRKSGIILIIEPPLEGTFLDGAALLVENHFPIIGMTLRHDRLDNFWFVLFHELAHIRLHLSGELNAIFDDLDDAKSEGIEHEADKFALDALIPSDVWRKSLVRFSYSKEAVINQAQKLHVHPALVAGRIRKETGKYHLLADVIGQGSVRKLFMEN